jgi:hypothetical protein
MASSLFIKRAAKDAKREYTPCDVIQIVLQSIEKKLSIVVKSHELVPKPIADMELKLEDQVLASFSATIHADDGGLALTLGELKAPTIDMCRAEMTPLITNINAKLNDTEDEGQIKLLRSLANTLGHYTMAEVSRRLRLAERLPPTDIGVILKSIVPAAKMSKLTEKRTVKGKFISTHQVMVGSKPITAELVAAYPPFIDEKKKDHEKIAHGKMKVRDVIVNIIAFYSVHPDNAEAAKLAIYFIRRLA